jgi:hypothetical protein
MELFVGDPAAKPQVPSRATDFATYEIWLACHLTERGAERFDGLEVTDDPHGNTCLSGRFERAALHGVLNNIRDLNLVRISVEQT